MVGMDEIPEADDEFDRIVTHQVDDEHSVVELELTTVEAVIDAAVGHVLASARAERRGRLDEADAAENRLYAILPTERDDLDEALNAAIGMLAAERRLHHRYRVKVRLTVAAGCLGLILPAALVSAVSFLASLGQ
ncbi:hypothetical protein FM104_12780 [Microbacterium esteraromaticum]|uniref:Uncharacterized protein n=2 Tax=Microbacterium esteraromaticum TaxID=57043 RepID=A0A1R4KHT5_9MICO|nr:hypothetical protein FM104_12780 [Microbacterium esteraromaticum]